jgi:hypothetical protein
MGVGQMKPLSRLWLFSYDAETGKRVVQDIYQQEYSLDEFMSHGIGREGLQLARKYGGMTHYALERGYVRDGEEYWPFKPVNLTVSRV